MYQQNSYFPNMSTAPQVAVEEDPTKAVIRLKELLKFESTVESQYTTTFQLAELVNELFAGIFPQDYEGCIIHVDPTTAILKASLYFAANGGGNVEPLIGQINQQKRNYVASLDAMNARNRNRTVQFSAEVKEALEELFFPEMRKNLNWDKNTAEQIENRPGGTRIYMAVHNIDIRQILKKVYGTKDDDGNRIDYNIQLVRAIDNSPSSNMVVSISRYFQAQIEDLAKNAGMIPSFGIPIIRRNR